MILDVTKETFEAEVLQSDKPVLAEFWATWCGPCKMMGPIIEQLAEENPDYKVVKINSDEEQELAEKFGILSIPTVIAFKDGKQVNQSVGVVPKDKLVALFSNT